MVCAVHGVVMMLRNKWMGKVNSYSDTQLSDICKANALLLGILCKVQIA